MNSSCEEMLERLKAANATLQREIAERRRVEAELGKSEAKYRELVESANSIIMHMDTEGRITFLNQFATKFFGYREDEILGRSCLGTIVPERESSGRDLAAMMQDLVKHPESYASNEHENIRKSGERVWVLWTNKAIRDAEGRVCGILGIGQDVTQRRQAEGRIGADEMRSRLAAIVESSNDAIISKKLDGTIITWNAAAERIYGYTAQEAIGKAITILHPPERSDESRMILAKINSGEQLTNFETTRIRKDGRRINASITLSPVRDVKGRIIAISSIHRDITRQKEAEEALQMYMVRLELSNQALQEFASIASHDMREPLRKILVFAQELKEDYGGSLGETGRDYLNRMQSAARRMESLLNSLLEYAQVTTRTEPCVSIDLASLVLEVLDDLEVRINQTGGMVEIGALPLIEADPNQMRQLFQNLIGNGLKYHRKDEKPRIKVYSRLTEDSNRCEIYVEDNGIGFDTEHLDHIFAPFHRLHGRSQYEGSGMGLAICKRIVERHMGSITARSRPGSGSTFVVTLPVKRRNAHQPPPAST